MSDTKNGKEFIYDNIPSLSYKKLKSYFQTIEEIVPHSGSGYEKPLTFEMDASTKTALLTVNTFGKRAYKNGKKGFQERLKKIFDTVSAKNIQNLIIDIRKNESGSQGMEDILLSHLIEKQPHKKYKYVEIPGFSYTFLDQIGYKNQANWLKEDLTEDFYLDNAGRYLNKKGHYEYEGTTSYPNHFTGNLYILINGLTFSGGSEFAALAKNYTNAMFIGEETGGGFYGNTSGSFIRFKLPNTGLTGRIPLCKFVVNNKDFGIPFGHGIMPDHKIQPTITEYLKGFDKELEFTKKLTKEKHHR